MIGPGDILATGTVTTPQEVVDTLTAWCSVAGLARVELKTLAAIVIVEADATSVTMGPRAQLRAELDDEDAPLLAVLDQPSPLHDELLVFIGRDDSDLAHVTTLAELQRGAQLQRQAQRAGLC